MNPEYMDFIFKAAGVVFGAGMIYSELRAIRKDIARLEKKQEESNCVKERLVKTEASCASAHKRISEFHYPLRRGEEE